MSTIHLGVILEADVSTPQGDSALAAQLGRELGDTYADLHWEVSVVRTELGESTDDSLDLLELTRDRMLDED